MANAEPDIKPAVVKKPFSLNEDAKNFVLQNEKLFKTLKKAANRYIGGETLAETILSIKKLNEKDYTVTTDFMGESIRNERDANDVTEEFIRFAKSIATEGMNSSISLDLSHIGLLVSTELTIKNLKLICEATAKSKQEVIISMEGTDRTDQIIAIYKESLKENSNLGITLQAYLYRTKDDLKDLINLSGSIRLVKGAYEASKDLSIPRGDELDEIYLQYAEQLFENNHHCAIASHDDKIYREITKLIDRYKPTNYFLERLLDIQNEELEIYKNKGYKCRIYVVYGKECYLYLCNRWAEYPLNVFRALADIVE
ncbi:proline dehydrogenase [Chryseobacterium glaciei]|uniref:Proline dehydrogenase n=1 Tax=Chryseobacterium glaciei TaxID=1685010 RepID=A0A172XQF0_9FLAO|nr:proline dehydrogenase family protein [Chryseobacterium glaciei]ANF49134.1 proline dehydrogenase [Chryseobacterium glaciei]